MQQRNTKKYRLRKEPVQHGVGQREGLSWTLRLNKNKTQMQNKIQNAKCRMQNAKCKMQNTIPHICHFFYTGKIFGE